VAAVRRWRRVRTYVAHYEQQHGAWVVTFGDPDISTWAGTLDKARVAAREALAVTLGYESVEDLARAVAVTDDVAVPDDARDDVALVVAERERIERDVARLQSARQRTIASLTSAGWSMRDIATLVGLSHQRVAQTAARLRTTS
jgi:DNA-directed RNA polymerase specialized sigma24 family protein